MNLHALLLPTINDENLKVLDSTTISIFLNVFSGVKFRTAVAAFDYVSGASIKDEGNGNNIYDVANVYFGGD